MGIKGVPKGKLNIKNYQRIVTKIVHEDLELDQTRVKDFF